MLRIQATGTARGQGPRAEVGGGSCSALRLPDLGDPQSSAVWMSALGANAARRTGHQRNGAGGIRHGDESSGDEFSGDDSA
jgi:hypothetical protein